MAFEKQICRYVLVSLKIDEQLASECSLTVMDLNMLLAHYAFEGVYVRHMYKMLFKDA